MGKIVKFCGSCDEGFAEKFGFCPNCGQTLQAFEMNPLASGAPPAQPEAAAALPVVEPTDPSILRAERVVELPAEVAAAEPVESYPAPVAEVEYVEDTPAAIEAATPVDEVARASTAYETLETFVEEPAVLEKPRKAAAAAIFTQTQPVYADRKPISLEDEHNAYMSEGAFYVTVIEEKNVGKRNLLMLGSLCFVLLALMTGLVINLFSKDLEVGSINDDIFNAVLVDDVPMTVEEEKKQKDDKDAGGGGGGGRDEKEEVTQGDLANQTKNPVRPPDAKVFRSDNFELKTPPPETEGNKTYERKFDRWGDPNGRFSNFSNGTGTGGGQGSGTGTGQGSGRGTGNGSGDGSGSGGGLGNGNGNGTGDGNGGSGFPPPPVRVGVTQALKIISKPRPGYTDSARQNNVQGTVILRVTFLASGQVGSISAVKGLPNGLTEQAIAAARRISFEPKKVDGVGQPVTRQIEYTFSIY
ncbi:MAG: TonB family protein [Pyrinomonadaceae bacterium]